jgi:peptidoglycan/LPS O-acetylase OafA/YrhL
MPATPARQTHIDALKCAAAQLIVLHHFALYGPLSQGLAQAAPDLAQWLRQYALMAVHVFLAMGGFLAARSLCATGTQRPWVSTVAERYARLMPPFAVALLLAVGCSALARSWLRDDFIPAAPTLWQILAHLGFVQDLVDVDALSAGVWYVAMDFQLYALLALLLRSGPRLGLALVLALMAASLLVFNRQPHLDEWALYFMGSYGLGAAAWRASRSPHAHHWLAALALLGLAALALDFRERLLLALATALGLGLWERHTRTASHARASRWRQSLRAGMAQQGASSFALFLLHFPVLLLANTFYSTQTPQSPTHAMAVLLAAWLVSVLGAMAFERWAERPLNRLIRPWAARQNKGPGGRFVA